MAIAFDASSASAAGTTGRSWTHTPVGTPKGVVVLVVQNAGATDEVTGATYGGVAMTEVTGSPLLHTTGSEDGAIYGYFLGTSVPTGAQTVAVSVNGTGSSKIAAAVTVTAAADTAVEDTATLESGSVSNPSVTLQTGVGVTTFAVGALHSGLNDSADIEVGTGYTYITTHDFGSQLANFQRLDTNPTGGDYSFVWDAGTEEAAVLAVAVKEDAAQEVTPALLTATATLFSPTVVNTQLVEPGLITQTATLYAPTVAPDQEVTPGLLTSAATLYAPLVANEQDVSPGIISLTSQIFAPLIVPDQDVSPALLTATATLYAPTVFVFDIGSATGSTATAQSAIGTDAPQSTSVGSTGTAQGAVGSEAGQTSAKGSSAAAYPGKATIHP